MLIFDEKQNANVIHFGSRNCKHVTRSVIATKLHALILSFDFGFLIREMMEEALCKDIESEAIIYIKTVFDVVAKDAKNGERRLQIDARALKEGYSRGELTKL